MLSSFRLSFLTSSPFPNPGVIEGIILDENSSDESDDEDLSILPQVCMYLHLHSSACTYFFLSLRVTGVNIARLWDVGSSTPHHLDCVGPLKSPLLLESSPSGCFFTTSALFPIDPLLLLKELSFVSVIILYSGGT